MRNIIRKARAEGKEPPWDIIQKILGHKSVKTTIDIYGEPSRKDVKEQYTKYVEGLY